MRRYALCISFILLLGCSALPRSTSVPEAPTSLQLPYPPEELNIETLRAMRLTGTGFTIGRTLARTNIATKSAISYESQGLRITGTLLLPEGREPFPLILTNHGHIDPLRYQSGQGLRREGDFLARRGFAVLHSDYRGHGGSENGSGGMIVYDASLAYAIDTGNAIHAVQSANLPQIDAERVGILGHSMGGGVAMNLAVTHPELVDALVLYAPVSLDVWQKYRKWQKNVPDPMVQNAFADRSENARLWDRLSAQTYLEDLSSPVLLVHGTEDESVPYAWSIDLADRLTQLGKDLRFVTYEGEVHEFIREWPAFMEDVAAFFDEHLAKSGRVEDPS